MEGSDENGPKRRQMRVVWAISKFFLFFSIVLILANIFYVYIGYEIRDRELEGGGNISGPNRRTWRRLGHHD